MPFKEICALGAPLWHVVDLGGRLPSHHLQATPRVLAVVLLALGPLVIGPVARAEPGRRTLPPLSPKTDATSSSACSASKCNSRSASAKWRRDDQINREIVFLPILRTVPASEQTRYGKFIGTYQNSNADVQPLDEKVAKAAGRILGEYLSKLKIVRYNKGDRDFIIVGYAKNDKGFSQFRFGAGEASIITMVIQIENAGDNALIFIEEVENGLHPVAAAKMVEYLVDVAKRKKQQVIFTTHSEVSLQVLPPEAIWACIDGSAYQGRLSIQSLRAMTGRIDKDSVVFVEDNFAKDWLDDIFKQYLPEDLLTTEIHAAGGYPYIISVVEHHNSNSSIKTKAKAVIDGDISEKFDREVVRNLPGSVPEIEVYNYIALNMERLTSKIRQRCLCPSIKQGDIIKAIEVAHIDTTDAHLLFSKLGDRLCFTSKAIVRKAFISIYNEENAENLASLISFLKSKRAVQT